MSLVVDEKRSYKNGAYYIHFRLCDIIHEMNLVCFSKLIQLPVGGMVNCFHKDYNMSSYWKKIICNTPPYGAHSSKATYICNPVVWYLQHLTSSSVSTKNDNQGVLRREKLFIL